MIRKTRASIPRWLLGGSLGFLLGWLVISFLFPGKEERIPRWPQRSSNLTSIPARRFPLREEPRPDGSQRADPSMGDGRGVFHGRLLDAVTFQPVPGAAVVLHEHQDSGVEADGEGLFRLEIAGSLPAVILIRREGYLPVHLSVEEVPDETVELFLPREMSLSFLVADDVTAAPIPGARVTVMQPAGPVSGVTDSEGLSGSIPVNPYLRLARGPDGSLENRVEALKVKAESSGYRPLQARVEAELGLTRVLLRLRPVRFLRGMTVDQRGFPVPAAQVAAEWHFNVGKDTTEYDSARTVSGARGEFELEVGSGRDGYVSVGAAKERYGPAVLGMDLDHLGTEESLVLTLPPGYGLEGRVTDREGNPLEEVRVSLDGEPLQKVPASLRADLGEAYGSPVGMTASDHDGYFIAPGLLPGTYKVSAFHPDHVLSRSMTVPIPFPGELRITLDAGEALSGVVADPENGVPIPGATILVNARGGEVEERAFDVNPDGEFLITGLRADLLYDLTAMASGYQHQNIWKVVPGTTDMVVILEPVKENAPGRSGRLRIQLACSGFRVHDSNGYFLVGFFDQKGNRLGSFKRRSAINGLIAIDNLPEGVFDVTVSSDRYSPVVLEDVAIDPEGSPIAVEVKPGCEVSGDESPPGSLPAGALIELRDPDHAAPFTIVHRRSGAWRLGVLERGRPYTLSITEKGILLGTQAFVADCGEPIPLRPPRQSASASE